MHHKEVISNIRKGKKGRILENPIITVKTISVYSNSCLKRFYSLSKSRNVLFSYYLKINNVLFIFEIEFIINVR